jgi:integrase
MRKTSYLEWEEYKSLLTKIKGSKLRLLIAFQGYCGLRVGDVLNLKWGDIVNNSEVVITEQKTGKKRTIYINDVLRSIINEEYREQYDDVYIFKSKFKNYPISIEYVNRELKRLFESNRIVYQGNVSSHLFRKTFGRKVMDMDEWSDKALVMLNEIYGHSTIATTKIYLGIREEEIRNVYHSLS